MNRNNVREFLQFSGWRTSRSMNREIWWKRFDAPRCKCNKDKDGIQAVVTFHEFEGRESYEVDVTGEKQDGVWVKLSAYGIQDNFCQLIDSQVAQLVAAWSLIAKPTAA